MPYRTDENDLRLRAYTASRFTNYERVRAFNDRLRDADILVSYDWTLTDEFDDEGHPFIPDDGLSPEQEARYGALDKRGVRTADVIVTLGHAGMKGAHWEGGLANAYGIPHIVVAPKEWCIFYREPTITLVDTEDEAFNEVMNLAWELV